MDALFEAMDLVAGRMVYLMSLRSNESSRVTFDIEHSMTVEMVSEYLEGNNLQVRFSVLIIFYLSYSIFISNN